MTILKSAPGRASRKRSVSHRISFNFADHQNSTRTVIDKYGAVKRTYDYDAFGTIQGAITTPGVVAHDTASAGVTPNTTDTHWDVNGNDAVATTRNPLWIANGTNGDGTPYGWISYDDNTHDSIDSSDTVRSFTTTVSVPAGANLGALMLSGRVASDNRINDILVNGVSTGIEVQSETGYGVWTPITLTAKDGLTSGNNTITFLVQNDGRPVSNNPTGLVVDWMSSALPERFMDEAQEYDAESGMHYSGGPASRYRIGGLWISQDPIEYGTNWYMQDDNNGIGKRDTSGARPFEPLGDYQLSIPDRLQIETDAYTDRIRYGTVFPSATERLQYDDPTAWAGLAPDVRQDSLWQRLLRSQDSLYAAKAQAAAYPVISGMLIQSAMNADRVVQGFANYDFRQQQVLQMVARVEGALGLVNSAFEIGAGLFGLAAPTGVSQVLGGLAVAHGIDNAASSFRQLSSGRVQRSFTAQSISSGFSGLGFDSQTSNAFGDTINSGAGMFLSIASPAYALTSSSAASFRGTSSIAQQEFRNTIRGNKAVSSSIRFGPHVEGPLPSNVANTFRSGSYSQVTLGADTTLYRTYGGTSGQMGPYWSRTAPSGPLQSRMDLALPPGNTAGNVIQMTAPQGTVIFEGVAGPNFGQLGGGNQVFIPKVNPRWVNP